jgi:hypothetical protein
MKNQNEKPDDVTPVAIDSLLSVRSIPHPWKQGETRNVYEFPVTRRIIIEADERLTDEDVLAMAKRCNDRELYLSITGSGYRIVLSSDNAQEMRAGSERNKTNA